MTRVHGEVVFQPEPVIISVVMFYVVTESRFHVRRR